MNFLSQQDINEDMGQIHFRSQSGHHAAQKLKSQKNIFFNGNCTMVICSSHWIFIQWGVVVFELCDAPFWSQSFRFAQTDGIYCRVNVNVKNVGAAGGAKLK